MKNYILQLTIHHSIKTKSIIWSVIISLLLLFGTSEALARERSEYITSTLGDEFIYEYEPHDDIVAMKSMLCGEEIYEEDEDYYYQSYSDYDLYVLSHVIYGEASGCSWDMLIAVGSVVLNRVYDSRYPDSIAGVVFQPGQYSCQSGGVFYRDTDSICTEAAIFLLENGSQLPSYVIYQSQFVQGEGIYMTIGNTYFCY